MYYLAKLFVISPHHENKLKCVDNKVENKTYLAAYAIHNCVTVIHQTAKSTFETFPFQSSLIT